MLDYFDMESTLSEEERMLVDSARSFIDGEVEDIGQHWIDGTFPMDLIPKMGEMGFYAPNLEGYGLPGVSETAYGLLMRELEACDSGLRSMASVQGALVMYPIHAFGSDAQKEEWLPKLGTGEAVGCFGLTEPEHGSNPSAMETRAEADGDDYVLNGSKTWITNSPIADVAVVWAKDHTEEGTPVRGFLVETDRDGVTTNKIDEKLSLRASITGEISLQDVHVPAENVLPEVTGMKGPLSCLTQARYGIAWARSAPPWTASRSPASTPPTASSSASRSAASRCNSRNSRRWRRRSRSRNCSPTGSPTSRRRARCGRNTSRWPSATTFAPPATSRGSPARCSAVTGSPPTTRRCVT